ncbi:MAG: hypothetical protein LBN71_07185 [Tannerella sp.]|nr:hypothetical protein [Tannerella sp.]
MEAIREIMDVERLKSIIDIPLWMQNTKVEVIVLPLAKNNASTHKTRSMMGFLKDYANPALVEQEKNA